VLLQYTVSEAYISGYSPTINKLENGTYVVEDWVESAQFTNGEKYLLKTSEGYLSTVSVTSNTLCFVDETTAKNSDLAFWTATVSSGKVKLTNQAGQSLNYYGSGSTRYFNATTGSANSQNLTTSTYSNGIRLSFKSGTRNYYLADLNNNNYAKAETSSGAALTFYPMVKTVTTTTVKLEGYGYTIINTPLKQETSLTVVKLWDYPLGDSSIYEKEQVTIRLLANGVDSGRTEKVSSKNEWTAVFNGLPYLDEAGNIIVYTVVENWETEDWIAVYGAVETVAGEIPTYQAVITNVYRWMGDYTLPGTGGGGTTCFVIFGLILAAGPFAYGFRMRCRYGRRSKQ
jgi:hypothetical protein